MKPSTPAAPLRNDGAFEHYDPLMSTHEAVAPFETRPPLRDVAAAAVGVVSTHLRAVAGLLRSLFGFALFCAAFPFTADYRETDKGIDRVFVSVIVGLFGAVFVVSGLIASVEVDDVFGLLLAVVFCVVGVWGIAPSLARMITAICSGVAGYVADAYRAELSKVKGPRT